jgi:uncharacterized membrane protein
MYHNVIIDTIVVPVLAILFGLAVGLPILLLALGH